MYRDGRSQYDVPRGEIKGHNPEEDILELTDADLEPVVQAELIKNLQTELKQLKDIKEGK